MIDWRRGRLAFPVFENPEPVPDRSGTGSVSMQDRSAVTEPVLASEHAGLFLRWLQAPGGRVGWIPADELAHAYAEFASDSGIAPLGWIAVGRELRRLLGASKTYLWRNGRKLRAYRIPASECLPLTASRFSRKVQVVER